MTQAEGPRLTVDLDALAANYACLAWEAAGAEVAPAVKADGYGLGAGAVARRLWAEGARRFFVARLSEGEALRRALGQQRAAGIYVLDGSSPATAPRLEAAGLTPVLNSLDQLEQWRGACALHVDTGMNRLGLPIEEAEALASAPDRLGRLDVELVMSHLACAAEPDHPMNAAQAERFGYAARLYPRARASLANSAGTFLGQAFRYDMVRPGISLYGGGPFGREDPRLRPVVRFEAPILQVRNVPAGETVGYGATFRADRSLQVAILASGYADGVLRASSPRGYGWLDGARVPMLGRVSMDLIAVDVTGVSAARPGALVELVGPHVALDEAARAADTIAYELLVRLGARAERLYSGEVG